MTSAEAFLAVAELVDFSEACFAHRLRTENPGWSEEKVQAAITAWFEQRPGAEFGDGEGVKGTWPRSKVP
jgi:hypothetical protein